MFYRTRSGVSHPLILGRVASVVAAAYVACGGRGWGRIVVVGPLGRRRLYQQSKQEFYRSNFGTMTTINKMFDRRGVPPQLAKQLLTAALREESQKNTFATMLKWLYHQVLLSTPYFLGSSTLYLCRLI